MRITVVALILSLAGCDYRAPPRFELRCVGGELYRRERPTDPWEAVDAAPYHAGFTPTPCTNS